MGESFDEERQKFEHVIAQYEDEMSTFYLHRRHPKPRIWNFVTQAGELAEQHHLPAIKVVALVQELVHFENVTVNLSAMAKDYEEDGLAQPGFAADLFLILERVLSDMRQRHVPRG